MTAPNPRAAGELPPPAPARGRQLPIPIAPALSAVGLLVIAAASYALLGGSLPTVTGPGGGPSGPGGPVRTATPPNVVTVDPRINIPGSLLYVKDGNVWIQERDQAHQLTSSGRDTMPTWSPDGATVYFIHNTPTTGKFLINGEVRTYNLSIPILMRIAADGSGGPQQILKGKYTNSGYAWSYFIREPAISPNGKTAALITDGPNPIRSDITLKLLNLQTKKLTDLELPESQSLGHQDPAWSADGKFLLYVKNAREGTRGTPTIARYTLATRKATNLTTAGYTAPSLSRDGRYVAATKTTSFGTDVVILDGRSGTELLRLTTDELSFSPVWSPLMDSIAFFRLDHGVVDLWLVPLSGAAPGWTVGEPIQVTVSAGLNALSRPAWFIPPDQLPPLPTPTPASTPGSSSGSP